MGRPCHKWRQNERKTETERDRQTRKREVLRGPAPKDKTVGDREVWPCSSAEEHAPNVFKALGVTPRTIKKKDERREQKGFVPVC